MLFFLALEGCDGRDAGAARPHEGSARAIVTNDGATITFPVESPGLLNIMSVRAARGSANIPVISPGRVVASIVAGFESKERIILFDSPDITSLYSQYRQNRANVERTTKNLLRVREMFSNQSATAKDINEAETEAVNAKASLAESEAKLRGLGFNPMELDAVRPGTAWLISDVPESQLHEVQQGEDVPLVFSSAPNRTFHGRAEAIGEVVDPVTRTVRVRVSVPNPSGRFLPGMFARVDFGDPIEGVILLPAAAVVTAEGADYAFVRTRPNQFERRRVTLASSGAKEVVVLTGVSDGEEVVIGGAMLLKGLSFGY
jgi:multidrug efflux pump subunit AcrA (membrane-fusion protein)